MPYLFSALLYLFTALFAAADASLVSFNLLAAFPALRWIRVHFLTLGFVSQMLFGVLPILVANLSHKPRPAMNWWVWLWLNTGFITLIAGFMGVNQALILFGGLAVFVATGLLLMQLWNLRSERLPISGWFYLTGVTYLLLGIIVGTGIWLNWGAVLHIRVPLEVHIHANSWGFMSLVFAGLVIDILPMLTGKPLASVQALRIIFWSMTLGALGIVLGPWLPADISLVPTVIGLVLHLGATVGLLVLMGQALKAGGYFQQPGGWHLFASYLWILLPVLVAPFIVLHILQSGPVESTAPQPLVYGWIFQFAIPLMPYLANRFLLHEKNPRLGGSWWSLGLLTVGGLLIWVSIYLPLGGALYGIGFAFYGLAFIQPMQELLAVLTKSLRLGVQVADRG
ncbi:MAG TPA: hypothetical protein PK299_01690 [Anaerolineales bacterium]|nr:hypothetical protein [Anaerolineales bacterium]